MKSEKYLRTEYLEAQVPLNQYRKDSVDIPKFLACCRQCPNYGTRWGCPPFEFDPMEIWNQYDTLHLRALVVYADGTDVDTLLAYLKEEKRRFTAELIAWERETPGSLALACGACDTCQTCSRVSAKACCYPETHRHSIEALGGDVGLTAEKYLKKPILWIQNGTAPEYMMLVGGLLCQEA